MEGRYQGIHCCALCDIPFLWGLSVRNPPQSTGLLDQHKTTFTCSPSRAASELRTCLLATSHCHVGTRNALKDAGIKPLLFISSTIPLHSSRGRPPGEPPTRRSRIQASWPASMPAAPQGRQSTACGSGTLGRQPPSTTSPPEPTFTNQFSPSPSP